jgi:hypothetical protein
MAGLEFDICVLVALKPHFHDFCFMSHAGANILKRSFGGDFDSLFLQLSDISSDCPSGAAKENCKIFLRQKGTLIQGFIGHANDLMLAQCTDSFFR